MLMLNNDILRASQKFHTNGCPKTKDIAHELQLSGQETKSKPAHKRLSVRSKIGTWFQQIMMIFRPA